MLRPTVRRRRSKAAVPKRVYMCTYIHICIYIYIDIDACERAMYIHSSRSIITTLDSRRYRRARRARRHVHHARVMDVARVLRNRAQLSVTVKRSRLDARGPLLPPLL